MYYSVGAAEGCDLLILFVSNSVIKPKDRSLVALDSSYGEMRTHEEPGLPAEQFLADVPNPCRSWLASEGGLPADQSPTP